MIAAEKIVMVQVRVPEWMTVRRFVRCNDPECVACTRLYPYSWQKWYVACEYNTTNGPKKQIVWFEYPDAAFNFARYLFRVGPYKLFGDRDPNEQSN